MIGLTANIYYSEIFLIESIIELFVLLNYIGKVMTFAETTIAG